HGGQRVAMGRGLLSRRLCGSAWRRVGLDDRRLPAPGGAGRFVGRPSGALPLGPPDRLPDRLPPHQSRLPGGADPATGAVEPRTAPAVPFRASARANRGGVHNLSARNRSAFAPPACPIEMTILLRRLIMPLRCDIGGWHGLNDRLEAVYP